MSVSKEKIDLVIGRLVAAAKTGNRIWLIGNGGSAATATHFAADLMRPLKNKKYKVRACSLSDNGIAISAIGNDFKFEDIFVKQIANLASVGDILFAISASGNSMNLIKSVELARDLKMFTISMVGFKGGTLKSICDNSLHFQTKVGEYEIAEDSHSIASHYIAMEVRRHLNEIKY